MAIQCCSESLLPRRRRCRFQPHYRYVHLSTLVPPFYTTPLMMKISSGRAAATRRELEISSALPEDQEFTQQRPYIGRGSTSVMPLILLGGISVVILISGERILGNAALFLGYPLVCWKPILARDVCVLHVISLVSK